MITDQGTELKEVPQRTLEELKTEYAQACGSAGELNYNIKENEAKLEMAYQHIFKLKQEYLEKEKKVNQPIVAVQDAHETEGHPFSETKAP